MFAEGELMFTGVLSARQHCERHVFCLQVQTLRTVLRLSVLAGHRRACNCGEPAGWHKSKGKVPWDRGIFEVLGHGAWSLYNATFTCCFNLQAKEKVWIWRFGAVQLSNGSIEASRGILSHPRYGIRVGALLAGVGVGLLEKGCGMHCAKSRE